MKLGYANHPRRDIIKEIRWIGEHHFDFVDLFLEADRCEPDQVNPVAVNQLLADYNLARVGHTPFYLPIGSPIRALRDAAVEIAKPYFATFAELGCPTVTIHAHWPPGMFNDREGVKYQTETLHRLVPLAAAAGVRIVYEPVDSVHDERENLAELLELNPEIGLHADLGHFNLCGRRPEAYLKEFGAKIEHVHLHDNDGKSDIHLPPGVGTIDWPRVVKLLKGCYDGTITIEVFARDKDYVLLARDKIRRLWDRK